MDARDGKGKMYIYHEYNLLCVTYTLGPPRPRVDLWGGEPMAKAIIIDTV